MITWCDTDCARRRMYQNVQKQCALLYKSAQRTFASDKFVFVFFLFFVFESIFVFVFFVFDFFVFVFFVFVFFFVLVFMFVFLFVLTSIERVGTEVVQRVNGSVADKVGGTAGDTKLTFYSIQHQTSHMSYIKAQMTLYTFSSG